MIDPSAVKVVRTAAGSVAKPTTGFLYVDQGNYLTRCLSNNGLTLYSDSATSCIITIVINRTANTVTLAHLDSASCIASFFDSVVAPGDGDLMIYAQGANPPDNATATENAEALRNAIGALEQRVIVQQLFLMEGIPNQQNRGDFGLTITPDGVTISNQPYSLTLTDRDPTCGGQTVYCIMRRQENPPTQIRDASIPFTHAELVELSDIALAFSKKGSAFRDIVTLQNEEIRQTWSTTPAYEAEWFSDQLKLGAAFAIAMAPVVALSATHLSKTTPTTFSTLRAALLGQ